MILRLVLLALGLFHLANGAWMLIAPDSWYAAIPGVPMTGPMNPHFIGGIGLAFIASGSGLLLGARAGATAATLALAGAAWPALHAFMHIVEWLEHGFPVRPDVALSEAVGVVAISFLGAGLAWLRAREEGVV